MREEKLAELMNELAERTAEPVRPGLAEDIKQQIPHRLVPHRRGMDTISIIVDLRISKLAAAAVILITMFLLANFFGDGGSPRDGIVEDGRLLLRYCLGVENAGRNDVLERMSGFCEYLTQQGREAVYYGDAVDGGDSNAVLMHWKLSDGKYRVISGDLREREVSADELIKLQSQMLQKRTR